MGMFYDRPTEPLKSPTIKGITCDVLVEVYIDICIAMACILGVADGHVDSLPTTVEEFDDGA